MAASFVLAVFAQDCAGVSGPLNMKSVKSQNWAKPRQDAELKFGAPKLDE